jgi:transcriptional regulator with XRE-family HTH domain
MSTFVTPIVRKMNKRLQQFLAAENISQSQFADAMGIARASVSHIIAGRNKPGFEFMSAMVRNYPALNLEWLISGKGKMYKDPSRILPGALHLVDGKICTMTGQQHYGE